MRSYTEGRLDRYRIGIPPELSEIRTQPWLSEGSLTCDPCRTQSMDLTGSHNPCSNLFSTEFVIFIVYNYCVLYCLLYAAFYMCVI